VEEEDCVSGFGGVPVFDVGAFYLEAPVVENSELMMFIDAMLEFEALGN
jgi:hypothetical protein